MNFTVSTDEMRDTLVQYLDCENESQLAGIIKVSEIVYDLRFEFSQIVSNQRSLYMSIRVPIQFKKLVEEKKDYLDGLAKNIYQNDSAYYFFGISSIGVKPFRAEDIEYNEKHYILEKDSTYANFFQFLMTFENLDDVQKKYLFEACECGNNKSILAATVMLGASAELLLIGLCEAYKTYLIAQNRTPSEIEQYDRKVIKARCANDRLTEFLKRAKSDAQIFANLGIENLDLAFQILDIIRKVRNDSGHPTGNDIPEEEFKSLLTAYQHYLPIFVDVIKRLQNNNVEI